MAISYYQIVTKELDVCQRTALSGCTPVYIQLQSSSEQLDTVSSHFKPLYAALKSLPRHFDIDIQRV
jgi:hypothetical protein